MRPMKTVVVLCCLCLFGVCPAAVRVGLDNVDSYRHLFRGKRVGIIANHTARTSEGKFVVDVFAEMKLGTVTALFGPEHGFRGAGQAGAEIDSAVDEVTRLPIYSLYGKTRKPTDEMLRNVDVLVFDIQDIGARFYTYIYTMSLAMEAAAEFDKQFVVLDRPNPINGLTVEGPVLRPEFASFVGMHPIPVRHGMTVGELAKMFNGQGWLAGGVRADLTVIPIKGWRRKMWYDQTGLKFMKPSPNIPDVETAAVYPGLCLLEGTNVSEGRGTNMPFKMFGAPWIDSRALAGRLRRIRPPGLSFEQAEFTPAMSKYKGERCHGVRIVISERSSFESFWSGVLIVNEIHKMYPDSFEWRASHFDRLCGTSTIRDAITAGESLNRLKSDWRRERGAFMRTRAKYLLYHD